MGVDSGFDAQEPLTWSASFACQMAPTPSRRVAPIGSDTHVSANRRVIALRPPLARQRRIDREGDQDGRLAPSPAGDQSDPPVPADELERLDLRGMQRRLGQSNDAAGKV